MKFFKLAAFLLVPTAFLLVPSAVSAHCPLCVGGAVIGLSVARFFGIDDAITGLWLAALLGAVSFWLMGRSPLFAKKFMRPAVYIALFGLTVWSFYAFNDWVIANLRFYLINKHAGQIAGLDKLTFGILIGGIIFYVVDVIDDFLIKRNGKVYFPYQRIVVSLGSILIASLVLYLVVNYYI